MRYPSHMVRGIGLLAVMAAAGLLQAEESGAAIDLQPVANQRLDETLSQRLQDSNLAALPQGEQTLGGINFKIGPACIQLGSTQRKDGPKKMEIPVGRTLAKLNILHGCQFGAYGDENHPYYVKDGTVVGQYDVHYADGGSETISLIYGEDLRDWWNWDQSKETKRAKVVWTGNNPASQMFNVELRLYLTTWKNPKPDMKVERIVFRSAMDTAAAPFCIALTAEK